MKTKMVCKVFCYKPNLFCFIISLSASMLLKTILWRFTRLYIWRIFLNCFHERELLCLDYVSLLIFFSLKLLPLPIHPAVEHVFSAAISFIRLCMPAVPISCCFSLLVHLVSCSSYLQFLLVLFNTIYIRNNFLTFSAV